MADRSTYRISGNGGSNVRVPVANLVGAEGEGFKIAMKNLDKSRPGIGAQAVGLAQGAIDESIAYARERRQFDAPIISFQAIQHMLADMVTQTEAARALVYAVARFIDSDPKDVSMASAMSNGRSARTQSPRRRATNASSPARPGPVLAPASGLSRKGNPARIVRSRCTSLR